MSVKTIEITRHTPNKSGGAALGFFDVTIWGFIKIYGCSLMQGSNGLFVKLPAKKDSKGSIDEKTGKVKWWDVVYIDQREEVGQGKGKQIMDAMLEEASNVFDATTMATPDDDGLPF